MVCNKKQTQQLFELLTFTTGLVTLKIIKLTQPQDPMCRAHRIKFNNHLYIQPGYIASQYPTPSDPKNNNYYYLKQTTKRYLVRVKLISFKMVNQCSTIIITQRRGTRQQGLWSGDWRLCGTWDYRLIAVVPRSVLKRGGST